MSTVNDAFRHLLFIALVAAPVVLSACAMQPKQKTLSIKDSTVHLVEDTIYHTETMTALQPEDVMESLSDTRIIYVGESHTNPSHHVLQLSVVQSMAETTPDLLIGMEMFDYTYQSVLDQWVSGSMGETEFLERTHWYANWRFDYNLYRDILEYAKEKGIRVIALNVPFHIPGKISVGGLNSLSEEDRRHLPETIDTGVTDHRDYVEQIFNMHAIRGRKKFEYFYEAQCTWEDAMAEVISDYLGSGKMVVLVGNGHIIRKFGVPNRAFQRTNAPFKTIYPVSVGSGEADPAWGDYLWATPEAPMPRMGMKHGKMKK